MAKINEAVGILVSNNPLYSILIKSNLVNYTNLAKALVPQVRALLKRDVKINTIVKALSLMTSHETEEETINFLSNANLSLEYKFLEKEVLNPGQIDPNFLVAYREDGTIKYLIGNESKGNLACIRISLPKEIAGKPGITLFLVQYLMMQHISIERIYRLSNQVILVSTLAEADSVVKHLSSLLYNSHL